MLGKYSLEEREMRKNAHTRCSSLSFLLPAPPVLSGLLPLPLSHQTHFKAPLLSHSDTGKKRPSPLRAGTCSS